MYSEKVMEEFQKPNNFGKMENPDAHGMVGNPKCGDIMAVDIKVNSETQVIEDIKVKTFGCVAAIATSSMMTKLADKKTLKEAFKLTNNKVAEELGGLPPIKMHCSNLAADALHKAIEDYMKKNGLEEKDFI
jgi:nitrogen fixation NifU-like protein